MLKTPPVHLQQGVLENILITKPGTDSGNGYNLNLARDVMGTNETSQNERLTPERETVPPGADHPLPTPLPLYRLLCMVPSMQVASWLPALLAVMPTSL